MTTVNVLKTKTFSRGLSIILVLVFASAAFLISFTAWDLLTLDPFDKFELLGVVSDSRLQRHAAMFRYYHANSSATVTAVWILSGKPVDWLEISSSRYTCIDVDWTSSIVAAELETKGGTVVSWK